MRQIRNRIIAHREIPAAELRRNPANWRRHPDRQRDALATTLELVGWVGEALVVETPDGPLLLDGHLRADLVDDQPIPCAVVDLEPDEASLILAALDTIGAMAEGDPTMIRELIESLDLDDLASAAALEVDAIRRLTDELASSWPLSSASPRGGLTDPNAAPAAPGEPETRLGDVWRLGEHALVCGDSSEPGVMAAALYAVGVERPRLVFTDPPYNVGARIGAGSTFGAGGSHAAQRRLGAAAWDRAFDVDRWLEALDAVRPVAGALYVCASHVTARDVWSWAERERGHTGMVVWCKSNPAPSLSRRSFTWATELICYATWGDHVFNFPDVGHALNWWEIQTNATNDLHPTMKPVELVERALGYSSLEGDVVLDPFIGSGTTIIAAERLGRRCAGVELDPAYCDVAARRWSDYTGREAKLERV